MFTLPLVLEELPCLRRVLVGEEPGVNLDVIPEILSVALASRLFFAPLQMLRVENGEHDVDD